MICLYKCNRTEIKLQLQLKGLSFQVFVVFVCCGCPQQDFLEGLEYTKGLSLPLLSSRWLLYFNRTETPNLFLRSPTATKHQTSGWLGFFVYDETNIAITTCMMTAGSLQECARDIVDLAL